MLFDRLMCPTTFNFSYIPSQSLNHHHHLLPQINYTRIYAHPAKTDPMWLSPLFCRCKLTTLLMFTFPISHHTNNYIQTLLIHSLYDHNLSFCITANVTCAHLVSGPWVKTTNLRSFLHHLLSTLDSHIQLTVSGISGKTLTKRLKVEGLDSRFCYINMRLYDCQYSSACLNALPLALSFLSP